MRGEYSYENHEQQQLPALSAQDNKFQLKCAQPIGDVQTKRLLPKDYLQIR